MDQFVLSMFTLLLYSVHDLINSGFSDSLFTLCFTLLSLFLHSSRDISDMASPYKALLEKAISGDSIFLRKNSYKFIPKFIPDILVIN